MPHRHLRSRSRSVWLLLCWAALVGPQAVAAEAEPAAPGGANLGAMLEKHCFDCHANGSSEGGLALDTLLAADDSPAARAEWRKVWKTVRHEFMPPVDAPRLEAADRKRLTQGIVAEALKIDGSRPDPGVVTVRRLNRVEYEYSVVDLFGVDFRSPGELADPSAAAESRIRDLLPPDDTAHGFDNIGDVQSLPPTLLEKYFEIAESLVARTVVAGRPWHPVRRIDAGSLTEEKGDAAGRLHAVREAEFDVAEPGSYRVEVRFDLGGWQEYGGRYAFEFAVDGESAASTTIDVGGNEKHEFVAVRDLPAGSHSVRLSAVTLEPDSEGELKHLEFSPRIDLIGPVSATVRSYPESHKRIFFRGEPPTDPVARREYAREVIERFATRAFRKPVDPPLLERLTDLATEDDVFERGVGNALVAVLTSPRFLFRWEMQPNPDDPEERHELDEFSLASRLSYLLWLSIPDEELLQAARDGRLGDELRGQVDRMLADPKSGRFFEDFAGQWLRTRNVLMTAISRGSGRLDPVRGAMKRETEMLFEHIARNDRDLVELLTADYTFLNGPLADYYGVEGVEGNQHRRVDLPPESHRGGILTHGSFLVSTSNPDRTSPVKRGLFVLENLLATEPPPPPPDIPPLEDAASAVGRRATVREQLEAHRADASCAACHAHFDPIGVALENFDLLGRWRDADRGTPIDPTTTTVNGDAIAGLDDLRRYVAADRERFYRCCTEKLMTYALGRGLEPFDAATVDEITDRLAAGGGKFSTLLHAIVASPAFQTRRGTGGLAGSSPEAYVPKPPPPEKRRPIPPGDRKRRDRDENGVFDGVEVIARPASPVPAGPPSAEANDD